MEDLRIVGYASTCLGLAEFLAGELEKAKERGLEFAFSLFQEGSTNEMIRMLQPGAAEPYTDIALFTIPEADLKRSDLSGIRIEKTVPFAFVVIAPEDAVGDVDFVTPKFLAGVRSIVTYGGKASGKQLLDQILGSEAMVGDVVVHGVPDTLTINEMVLAGIGVGVAVGKAERYQPAPGLVGVPLQTANGFIPWWSCVAIRESRYSASNSVARMVFDDLIVEDREKPPGWLTTNPTLGLHPQQREIVDAMANQLGLRTGDVVAQAIDLFEIAADAIGDKKILTVTDPARGRSYKIDLEIENGRESMEDRLGGNQEKAGA